MFTFASSNADGSVTVYKAELDIESKGITVLANYPRMVLDYPMYTNFLLSSKTMHNRRKSWMLAGSQKGQGTFTLYQSQNVTIYIYLYLNSHLF